MSACLIEIIDCDDVILEVCGVRGYFQEIVCSIHRLIEENFAFDAVILERECSHYSPVQIIFLS